MRACPALRQVRHRKDLQGRECQLQTSSEHSLFSTPCLQHSLAFTLKLPVFLLQPTSSGVIWGPQLTSRSTLNSHVYLQDGYLIFYPLS